LLVTEYAEGGTLRNYLRENFSSLSWRDKYRLAFQLSSAVEYLHKKEIVHKDLHSKNIFIHQNSIKLADFGLSNRIKNTNQISFDTIPYNCPEEFDIAREKKQNSKTSIISGVAKSLFSDVDDFNWKTSNKKSDIYSIGVLFWEISSGKKPFADKEYGLFLAMEIAQGLREDIVEGTPKEYFNLYTSK
jgi:serine/threonine protein kinase